MYYFYLSSPNVIYVTVKSGKFSLQKSYLNKKSLFISGEEKIVRRHPPQDGEDRGLLLREHSARIWGRSWSVEMYGFQNWIILKRLILWYYSCQLLALSVSEWDNTNIDDALDLEQRVLKKRNRQCRGDKSEVYRIPHAGNKWKYNQEMISMDSCFWQLEVVLTRCCFEHNLQAVPTVNSSNWICYHFYRP